MGHKSWLGWLRRSITRHVLSDVAVVLSLDCVCLCMTRGECAGRADYKVNSPMQYAAIFMVVKVVNFQMKNCNFVKTYENGYSCLNRLGKAVLTRTYINCR